MYNLCSEIGKPLHLRFDIDIFSYPRGDGQSDWPIIVAAWLGQVTCGFAFSVGYVYTNELFPTTHRTLALSLSSAGARVGSVSSPAIAMLGWS